MVRSCSEKRPSEIGQGLVEYALILVLVGVVVLVSLLLMGPNIGNVFSEVVSAIESPGQVVEEVVEENDVVVITRADYNSGGQSLHLDATSDGGYDAGVTLTASPGGVMEARTGGLGHYHLDYSLPGCPCTVTVTSSEGGSASVTVGP